MSADRDGKGKGRGTNIAIMAGILLVPLVVATGFLTDRMTGSPATEQAALWPELRGTFDGDAATAAPARPGPGQ